MPAHRIPFPRTQVPWPEARARPYRLGGARVCAMCTFIPSLTVMYKSITNLLLYKPKRNLSTNMGQVPQHTFSTLFLLFSIELLTIYSSLIFCDSIAPEVVLVTGMYKHRGVPCHGGDKTCGLLRYSLILLKAIWHYSSHSALSSFFRLKISSQVIVCLEMNLLMYYSFPRKPQIYFSDFGGGISLIALFIYGSISIRRCERVKK